jgi:hypothetical protein
MRQYLHHCSMFWALMTQDANTESHYQIRRRLAVVIVGLLTAAGLSVFLWLEFGSEVALATAAGLLMGFILGVIFSMLWRFED